MQTGLFVSAIVALSAAAALHSGVAVADSLTRTSCWTAKFDDGATRTICPSGTRRATMRNHSHVVNSTQWSQCQWTGDYFQQGDKVVLVFAQGSGRCSNRAASPQWTAVCDFDGNKLDCYGASVVDGKAYEISGTFE